MPDLQDYVAQPPIKNLRVENGLLVLERVDGGKSEIELPGAAAKTGKLILSSPSAAFPSGAHVTHVWNNLVHKSSDDVDDWLEWLADRADGRVNILEEGVYSVGCQVNANHDTITDGEHQLKLYCRHATKPDLSLVTRIPTAEAGRSGDTYYTQVLPAQVLEAGYYIYARSNWNYGTPGAPSGFAQLIVSRIS